ncbi:MAG: hypothetical protein L3J82_03040 [Planctomycetes bacterium]|nr:hypothetical protein [Planctomycetota bacterium]
MNIRTLILLTIFCFHAGCKGQHTEESQVSTEDQIIFYQCYYVSSKELAEVLNELFPETGVQQWVANFNDDDNSLTVRGDSAGQLDIQRIINKLDRPSNLLQIDSRTNKSTIGLVEIENLKVGWNEIKVRQGPEAENDGYSEDYMIMHFDEQTIFCIGPQMEIQLRGRMRELPEEDLVVNWYVGVTVSRSKYDDKYVLKLEVLRDDKDFGDIKVEAEYTIALGERNHYSFVDRDKKIKRSIEVKIERYPERVFSMTSK